MDDPDVIFVLWDEKKERQRNRLASGEVPWLDNMDPLPIVTSESWLTNSLIMRTSGTFVSYVGQPVYVKIDEMTFRRAKTKWVAQRNP